MEGWIAQVAGFATAHPHAIGLVVFAAAASEAIVVVGALIPGTAVVLALAGIAGATHMPVLPLVLWASAGAVVSDGISYWIGHRFGPHLRERWPFRDRPGLLLSGERFFARHGGKSVVLARFLPGVRAVVPVVAGMVGMPVIRFYMANIASAVLWGVTHVLPAAGAGLAFAQLGQVSGRLLLLLLAAPVAAWLAILLLRLALRRLLPRGLALWRACATRFARSDRPMVRRVGALLDPDHPAAVAVLFWFAVGLASTYGLLGVVEDVLTADPLVAADRAISNLVQSLRSEPLDAVVVAVTMLGDGVVTVPLALVSILVLLLAGARRSAAALLILEGATALAVPLVKWLVGRPRPLAGLYPGVDAFALPSGHATFAAVVWGCLAVVLARGLSWRWRLRIYGAAAVVIVAIGLSRIYLAAHWPSDVLAGWCLGLVVTAAFALVAERSDPSARLRPALRLLPAGVLLAAYGVHVARDHEAALARYGSAPPPVVLARAEWLDGSWARLAQRRIDLEGEGEEPLDVQCAGDPAAPARLLEAHGFAVAAMPAASALLAFLRPDAAVDELPVPPRLHDGRLPVLQMVRTLDAGTRLVLRLWPAGFVLEGVSGPGMLHLAALTVESVEHPFGLLSVPRGRPAADAQIVALQKVLALPPPAGAGCRIVPRQALPPLALCDVREASRRARTSAARRAAIRRGAGDPARAATPRGSRRSRSRPRTARR